MKRFSTNSEIIEAWANNEVFCPIFSGPLAHCGHICCDDGAIWNYNTILAQRRGNSVVFNKTRYSTTTSRIQNELLQCLKDAGANVIVVDGISEDTRVLDEYFNSYGYGINNK